MKAKLLLATLIFLTVAACQKDNPVPPADNHDSVVTGDVNLADAFVGTWDATTKAVMQAPILGSITREEKTTYTIADQGDGNVSITVTSDDYGTSSTDGVVDEAGLHMGSYQQQSTFLGFSFTMTVAPTLIPKPSADTLAWSTTISGTVGFYNANGTLDITATKR